MYNYIYIYIHIYIYIYRTILYILWSCWGTDVSQFFFSCLRKVARASAPDAGTPEPLSPETGKVGENQTWRSGVYPAKVIWETAG